MINDPAVLKFCMVRNPYDRIFSAWKSKVLRRMDTQYQELRDRMLQHARHLTSSGSGASMRAGSGSVAQNAATHLVGARVVRPDVVDVARFPGTWRLARKFARTGVDEVLRSLSEGQLLLY